MLRHLCAKLKDALKLDDEIKQDVPELSDQFREFLAKVPEKLPKGRRVLLVLNALIPVSELARIPIHDMKTWALLQWFRASRVAEPRVPK